MFFSLFVSLTTFAAPISYPVRPPAILVVVIDQLRSDQLAKLKTDGTFGALRARGAYFPQASYGLFASMTCPGHVTILSGSYPRKNGIAYNAWFDHELGKVMYCVADPIHGLSPKNIQGTTVGNELKVAVKNSRNFAFSIKDRSAIGLAGAAADAVFWYDDKKGAFTTSTFYSQELTPAWLQSVSAELKAAGLNKGSLATTLAIGGLTNAVLAGIKHFKIGSRAGTTDLLSVSYSSHDILGHDKGPQALEMESHLRTIDREVGRLIAALPANTLVVLTSDHGIPHTPAELKALNLDGARFDGSVLRADLEEKLKKRFGEGDPLISDCKGIGVSIARGSIAKRGLALAEVAKAIKEIMNAVPWSEHFSDALLASDLVEGRWPVGLAGEQLKNSFIPTRSPDVIGVLRAYHFEDDDNTVNHMTGYAYDRTVPILFAGPGIVRGVFAGGQVIDIAPTLSFLLGIVPPAYSEGRVLSEALLTSQFK